MRFAVVAYKPCTVDKKGDWHVLQCHVMQNLIVCTLQKGGINANKRVLAAASQSSCECNGMLLGNTHVKKSIWILCCKFRKTYGRRHRRAYGNYSVIRFRKAHKIVGHHF